jgi:hypothetical protein
MTERLLQYIWQFQYFNTKNLQTINGESLQVLHSGTYNTNQGPDFLNAKVRTGDTTWAGNIEIHIHASDWFSHQHSDDKNYSNIILHVVWKNDNHVVLPFPTLELQPIVSSILLGKYEELMQSALFIPCQQHINNVSPITFTAWKERLLVERLQQKALYIETLLARNNQHWEECFWWILAKNFGIKINAEAFEKIAQSIPVNILTRHKNQVQQLEALLMGQAALLDKTFEEDYPNMLRREYIFLQKKYRLRKAHAPLYFLRMRPANFPTIRLAQLAALIHESHHFFSVIKESEKIEPIKKILKVTANDYWHYHYMFDEETEYQKKVLGEQMIQNILVNTIIPMLYAYGYLNNNESFKTRALLWMEKVHAEKNSITRGFQLLGVETKSASDSQALIQLKNLYCNYKQCLRCAVGNQVIKGGDRGMERGK